MDTKQIIDQFFELQEAVHKAFGYTEDWVVIPLEDSREMYWRLNAAGDDTSGDVLFAESIEELDDGEVYYQNDIYTQRFLSKYVYRTEEFTMICVDTHTDGNKFLQIFDNTKEVKV